MVHHPSGKHPAAESGFNTSGIHRMGVNDLNFDLKFELVNLAISYRQ